MLTDPIIDYTSATDQKITNLLSTRDEIAQLQERSGIEQNALRLTSPFLAKHLGDFVFIIDDRNIGVRQKNGFINALDSLVQERCGVGINPISSQFLQEEIARGNALYSENGIIAIKMALPLNQIDSKLAISEQFTNQLQKEVDNPLLSLMVSSGSKLYEPSKKLQK